jgi:hypothetical protein
MRMFKIGDQWYKLDGAQLVKIDAPETEPAEGEFFDASTLVTEFDGIGELTAVADRANELIGEYNRLRTEAATDPSKLTEAKTAYDASLVARVLHGERKTALDGLPEAGALPNEPAPTETDDKPTETDDKPDETPDETPDGTDVTVPDDASSLTQSMQLVTAAAAAAGVDPADVFARLVPGGGDKPAGAPARTEPRQQATIIAAADIGFGGGHDMSLDDLATAHQRFAKSRRHNTAAVAQTIATIEMYGDAPSMVASAQAVEAAADRKIDAASAAEFHARRAGSRGMTAAAPDRCGPPDVRREIKYAGDDTSPLLNLVETYPSPHCELEYYKDISLSDASPGVGRWTEAARSAYQTALDNWRSTQDAATLAALKAAEKLCVIADCPPTGNVTMLPIYACIEYPTDLEVCSPQAIRAYMRALNRAWIRERSSNFLAVLATMSARVTVDASDGFFENADTTPIRLGAGGVLDYVMSTLMGMGVMDERVTEGDYVAVVPYGLQRLLEMEGRLAEGVSAISDTLGGIRTITSLDVATGSSLPWTSMPAQDGTTTDFVGALLPPSAWDIAVFDPSDFFAITRPDIELGAQVTPETIRGNMVFGGFMESHEGYGKDGAHPSWTIAASNLVYNGVRPDKASAAGLLTV